MTHLPTDPIRDPHANMADNLRRREAARRAPTGDIGMLLKQMSAWAVCECEHDYEAHGNRADGRCEHKGAFYGTRCGCPSFSLRGTAR